MKPEPRIVIPASEPYRMVERKVGDLWIDPHVQRALKKARVETMAKSFRADALGVLTTSFRSADRIHVIDGQHRYRAAEAAAYTGTIQTMEYYGLTIPQEAALFRLLNTTEKVSRIDQFLIACVEQDPAAVRLASFLTEHGWTVGTGATESRLSAIASLERVYALRPEAADRTLGVLTAAFDHRPAAVQGALLEGLGRVLAKYHDYDVNLPDLVKKLAGFPGGPDGIVGLARGQAVSRASNLSTQVARIIVGLYNQRRRTSQLPEWQ